MNLAPMPQDSRPTGRITRKPRVVESASGALAGSAGHSRLVRFCLREFDTTGSRNLCTLA
jgi:hypothetical protein